ncbi:choice-of-anchor P family protein [Delftia lacustris]|uniref:Uncharacterized protein n=1 Tax=Delftia lacustris TaxID=558537 RepID=A0A1H3TMF1_9BURK|nr:choice-of-anchor P family protein [Delftia lacustris]SDZ50991.1 hypothetical protein SAMN05421547_13039 [Delftia lacustris]
MQKLGIGGIGGIGNRPKIVRIAAAIAASCSVLVGAGSTAWAASAGQGRGYALEVEASIALAGLGLDVPLADTGAQSAPPTFNVSRQVLSADTGTGGLISLQAGVLTGSTESSLGQNTVTSAASISNVNLSIASSVTLKADALESRAQMACVNGTIQSTGTANLVNLTISALGLPVSIPANPAPNTGLDAGILAIVLNEQKTTGKIFTVNALRIGVNIPLVKANLVFGHSEASIEDCATVAGDTTSPSVAITTFPVINAGNQNAYTVAGSCTAGDGDVKVAIGTAPKSVTMTTACNAAGAWTAPAANVAGLPQGMVTITAVQTDAAGNVGTQSVITSKTTGAVTDTTAPAIAVLNPAAINAGNQGAYVLSGTCTAGDGDIKVSIGTAPNAIVATAACDGGGRWTIPATNVSSLPAGTVAVQASQTDAAGNTGTVSIIVNKADTTPPTVTMVTAPQINAGNQGAYILSGTCTVGAGNVTVTIGTAPDAVVATAPCDSNGDWTTPATDVSVLPAGTVGIHVAQTNAAGNSGTADATVTKVDTTPPTTPSVTVVNPPPIDAGNQGGYILSGSCTAGGGSVTVTIGTAPKAVVVTVPCDGNGHWTTPATDVSGLPKGSVTITVTQTQATGDVDSSTATTTKTTPGAGDAPGSDSVAAIPVGGAWASLLLLGAAALGLRRRGRQPGPQCSGRHHD